MTIEVVEQGIYKELESLIEGELFYPRHPEYETRRKVYNLAIDRYPSVIVKCINKNDISACLKFCVRNKIKFSIKSSGHSAAGLSVCDNGLVIDLTSLKSITINSEQRTAWVEPGVNWAEFDQEAQKYGLAMPGGTVSTTSVSGFTLGGGLGWLMGSYGLACDNLIAAEVITADGAFILTDGDMNPELLWALRGGGGNFCIVSKFKFQLHSVPKVTAGSISIPIENAKKALLKYADMRSTLPSELVICPTFITNSKGPHLSFDICYNGGLGGAERALSSFLNEFSEFPTSIQETSYCVWQRIYDPSFDTRMRGYWKSCFFYDLSEEMIDIIISAYKDNKSPHAVLILECFHGAYKKIPTHGSCFGHRDKNFSLLIANRWVSKEEDFVHTSWTKSLALSLSKFTDGSAYINYIGQEDAELVRKSYGDTFYQRIQEIKNIYDPENIFNSNHGISTSEKRGLNHAEETASTEFNYQFN